MCEVRADTARGYLVMSHARKFCLLHRESHLFCVLLHVAYLSCDRGSLLRGETQNKDTQVIAYTYKCEAEYVISQLHVSRVAIHTRVSPNRTSQVAGFVAILRAGHYPRWTATRWTDGMVEYCRHHRAKHS